MMKFSSSHTLKLLLSLFLLVLILLMLGYALATLPHWFPDSLKDGAILPSGVPIEVVATLVGAFAGVVGLIITSIFSWREDRRRENYYEIEMEQQKLTIEKLKLQLQLLRGEPPKAGQSQPGK
jgi:hypothetical protein